MKPTHLQYSLFFQFSAQKKGGINAKLGFLIWKNFMLGASKVHLMLPFISLTNRRDT